MCISQNVEGALSEKLKRFMESFAYYFHVRKNISCDFNICISVALRVTDWSLIHYELYVLEAIARGVYIFYQLLQICLQNDRYI